MAWPVNRSPQRRAARILGGLGHGRPSGPLRPRSRPARRVRRAGRPAAGPSRRSGCRWRCPQRPARHLLFGAVSEIAAPILGQRAVPLSSQHMRALEELLEHSRTSKADETGSRSDYGEKVMWRSTSCECENPRLKSHRRHITGYATQERYVVDHIRARTRTKQRVRQVVEEQVDEEVLAIEGDPCWRAMKAKPLPSSSRNCCSRAIRPRSRSDSRNRSSWRSPVNSRTKGSFTRSAGTWISRPSRARASTPSRSRLMASRSKSSEPICRSSSRVEPACGDGLGLVEGPGVGVADAEQEAVMRSRTIRDAVRRESDRSRRRPACCGGWTGRIPCRIRRPGVRRAPPGRDAP